MRTPDKEATMRREWLGQEHGQVLIQVALYLVVLLGIHGGRGADEEVFNDDCRTRLFAAAHLSG